MKNIERLFKVVDNSLFTINGKLSYDRLQDALIILANTVHSYEGDTEQIWYIGEYSSCCLSDLITGAYWHFTDWHGGQDSKSYATLCALGQVFNPGMEVSEIDNMAYQMLNQLAEINQRESV